ncbi:MAG: UDP-N-acetylmuramoyl-L-alanine--D-glutamate ligase [Bacteroidota bacterium]
MKYDKIISQIIGRKLLILGFGKEGFASYSFIRKILPDIQLSIADKNTQLLDLYPVLAEDKNVLFNLGDAYLENLNSYDLIIKTPGISFSKNNINIAAEKITSQTDLFLSQFSTQIIGITGTKGKSTTSSLIYHVLKAKFDDVLLVGNIGLPPFDFVDSITENTKIVFELSSHQLEYVKFAPNISIILNIYQEHLDHYHSYSDYQKAKLNIALKQNEDDYFIYCSDNQLLCDLVKTNLIKSEKLEFSNAESISGNGVFLKENNLVEKEDELTNEVYDINSTRYLLGNHNLLNISAAYLACELLGVEPDFFFEKMSSFKGLPHRMQFVGEFDRIKYYNDSIATIPEATIQAITALKEVGSLILGGFDRGIDYSILINYLAANPIDYIYFMGDAGKRMYDAVDETCKYRSRLVSDLQEAVDLAKKNTKVGKICLLSPAASSYDKFKNFEHRGDYFIKLVSE